MSAPQAVSAGVCSFPCSLFHFPSVCMDPRSTVRVTCRAGSKQLELCRPLDLTWSCSVPGTCKSDCLFGCWNLSLILRNKFLKSFTMLFIYWLPNTRILMLIRCILGTERSCNCSVKNWLTVWVTSMVDELCGVPRGLLGLGRDLCVPVAHCLQLELPLCCQRSCCAPGGEQQCRAEWDSFTPGSVSFPWSPVSVCFK